MQQIKNYVITIAAAVVLLCMVDVLLPQGNIRKICNVAVGIILMTVMILPITQMISGRLQAEHSLRDYEAQLEGSRMELTYEQKTARDAAWEVYIRNRDHIDDIGIAQESR